MIDLKNERDRLLDMYYRAKGEERITTVRGWRQRNGLIANNGVPMEWVLTADECKVMRRFLADLKKAYALNSNLNVGKFMKMYRYLLNGYHHGRKIVAT